MNSARMKQVGFSLLGILVLVGIGIGTRIVLINVFGGSKADQVSQFVEKSKQNLKVPAKIDQYTTLSDIKADGDSAAILEYSISSGIKASDVSVEKLKSSAASTECADEGGREALKKGITLKHHYTFADSSETLDYDVTEADCS